MTAPRDLSAVQASLESLAHSMSSELKELETTLARIKLAASAVVNARKNGTDNEVLLASALLVTAVLGSEAMAPKVNVTIEDFGETVTAS